MEDLTFIYVIYDIITDDNDKALETILKDQEYANKSKRFLVYAIIQKSHKCILLLLNKVEELNKYFYMDNMYLYIATQHQNAMLIKILLEKGSNPNTLTGDNYFPLAIAMEEKDDYIVDLLQKYGAKLEPLVYYFDIVLEYNKETMTRQIIDYMNLKQLHVAKAHMDKQEKTPENEKIKQYITYKLHKSWSTIDNILSHKNHSFQHIGQHIKKFIHTTN